MIALLALFASSASAGSLDLLVTYDLAGPAEVTVGETYQARIPAGGIVVDSVPPIPGDVSGELNLVAACPRARARPRWPWTEPRA